MVLREKPSTPSPAPWTSVSVFRNDKFWIFASNASYRMAVQDPKGITQITPGETDAEELGNVFLSVLEKSRFLPPDDPDFDEVMDLKTGDREFELWASKVAGDTGYPNARALFKNMVNVSTRKRNDRLRFRPFRQTGFDSWTAIQGIEDIAIPVDASAKEIGEALIKAANLCK